MADPIPCQVCGSEANASSRELGIYCLQCGNQIAASPEAEAESEAEADEEDTTE